MGPIPPITMGFLIAIGVAFLVQYVVPPDVWEPLVLQAGDVLGLQIWQLLSYGFLHGGLGHLFANAIGLFFFGPIVEQYLGGRRYTRFLLAAVLAGGLAHTVFYLVRGEPGAGLVGFSGAVFAILAGCLKVSPHSQVYLYGVLPMKLRTLVIGYVILEVLLFSRQNAMGASTGISHLGHLAGAAVGWWFINKPHLLDFSFRGRGGGGGGGGGGRRERGRHIMGHPGRHTTADKRYDDPHWRLDQ